MNILKAYMIVACAVLVVYVVVITHFVLSMPSEAELSKTHYCEKIPYKQYKYGPDSYYCNWVKKPPAKEIKIDSIIIEGDSVKYIFK